MSYSFPADWYFQVTGSSPSTQVWKSATGAFVAMNTASFTTWMTDLCADGIANSAVLCALVSGAADNGSGLIRITLDRIVPWATGDIKTIASVGGTTEANATWTVTKISSTVFDLQASTFTHAYTSGGVMGAGDVQATETTLNTFIDLYNQRLLSLGRFTGVLSNSVNANATLVNPLHLINIFNIGSGHHVSLPQANLFGSVPIGSAQVSQFNNGSATFDIFDFAANNLGTVQVGEVAFCIMTSNSTQEGTWQITKESIISGFTPLGSGGTGADLSATGGTSKFLRQNSVGAVVDVVQPSFSMLSGSASAAQLPNPTASTLGGIESLAAVASNWINQISTSGVPSATQPAFTDISGVATAAQTPALTGDVTKSSGSAATTLAAGSASNLNSGTLAAARGGAGTINGALKGNGSGVVSQAAAADLSDYSTGTWTPADGSGASLTLANVAGAYTKIGNMVFAYARFDYPATANGSNNTISGLPFTAGAGSRSQMGFISYSTNSTARYAANNPSATTFAVYDSSGTALTNAQMASKVYLVMLCYPVA